MDDSFSFSMLLPILYVFHLFDFSYSYGYIMAPNCGFNLHSLMTHDLLYFIMHLLASCMISLVKYSYSNSPMENCGTEVLHSSQLHCGLEINNSPNWESGSLGQGCDKETDHIPICPGHEAGAASSTSAVASAHFTRSSLSHLCQGWCLYSSLGYLWVSLVVQLFPALFPLPAKQGT